MVVKTFNWRPYPFIRILAGTITGIIIESLISIPFNLWALSSAFFVSLIFFLISTGRRFSSYGNRITGVLVLLLFTLLGIISVKFQSPWLSANYYGKQIHADYQEIIVRADDIHLTDKWIKVFGEVRMVKDNSGLYSKTEGKILLYLQPQDTQIHYGQILNVSTRIHSIPCPKNPNAFNYKKYMANNDIYFQGFCRSKYWKLTNVYESNLLIIARQTREKLLGLLKEHLGDGQEYAVGSALLFGFRDEVSEEVNNAYIQTGSIHILAVSGMHVGILSSMLGFLMGLSKRNSLKLRLLKLFTVLAFIWGFVLIVGAGPSVIRAAVMFSILHTGTMMYRRKYIYNTLAASAFVILIWSPKMVFDVGFLLSYFAVIGIVAIQPLLLKLWKPGNRVWSTIWDLTTVTLAAQLATLPLILYYFNQTSLYFLISGVLVVPISTVAMYVGVVLFLSSLILPFLTGLIGSLMFGCLYLMNSIIYGIQSLPGNLLDNIAFSLVESALLIICIFLLVYSLLYRHKTSLKYAIASLFLLTVVRACFIVNSSYQDQIVFYSSSKGTMIDSFVGRTCFSLFDEENPKEEKYVARSNRISNGIRDVIGCSLSDRMSSLNYNYNQYNLSANKTKVFFLGKESEAFYGNTNAENVYVIDNNIPDKIIPNIMTKRIILNANMPYKVANYWKEWAMQKMVEVVDLKDNAFIIKY